MGPKEFVAILLVLTGSSLPLSGQVLPIPQRLAKIRVIAFDTSGKLLQTPVVAVFDSDEGKHLADEFHSGVAVGVPYGTYRIEAHLTAYASDIRYVRVYQPNVTVILGLTLSEELPEVPPTLRGCITSQGELPENVFVKLLGVYNTISMEAYVSANGGFELGGLTVGRFLLLAIDKSGILASKVVTIPYSGPPLELNVPPTR